MFEQINADWHTMLIGINRTLSNIYDGAFEGKMLTSFVNVLTSKYFHKKRLSADVREGPKNASINIE